MYPMRGAKSADFNVLALVSKLVDADERIPAASEFIDQFAELAIEFIFSLRSKM